MPDPLATAFGVPYPYTTGYCDINGVVARINAGNWDPTKPTAAPTVAQVTNWLCEATATIDSVLATRGYFVPLAPITGWLPPTGMQTYQGIGLGAWLMLRSIAAAYTCHYVEASRHGSVGASQDTNATDWATVYDDYLSRIEAGTDNLNIYGVGGPFAPDPDPAHGASSGALGAFIGSASGQAERPIFSRNLNLGDGLGLSASSTVPQF